MVHITAYDSRKPNVRMRFIYNFYIIPSDDLSHNIFYICAFKLKEFLFPGSCLFKINLFHCYFSLLVKRGLVDPGLMTLEF